LQPVLDFRRAQEETDLGDAAEIAQPFFLISETEASDAEDGLRVGAAEVGGPLAERKNVFEGLGETGAALAGDKHGGKAAAVERDDVVFAEGEVGAVG